MKRLMYYYDTTATSVTYSIVRLKDGYVWNQTEEEYQAPDAAGFTFADTLVSATAVAVLGAWDIQIPINTTIEDSGVYQVAIYADPSGSDPLQPDMGQVVYQQSGSELSIMNVK